jgi:hypothetical protein
VQMAELYEYAGFEVGIETDVITPALIWESRHIEWSRKMQSNEIYDALSDEEREVTVEKVRRCMEVMYDYAEEWVPDSFSIDESGAVLKIELNLVVTDLEEDVIERYKATSARRREAMRELKQLLEEDANEANGS